MLGSKAEAAVGAEHNGDGAADELQVDVAHAIPGRLRLRIAELKEDPELAGQIERRLRSLEQLRSLELNPRAGSVVLHYEPRAQAAFAASLRCIFPKLDDVQPQKPAKAVGSDAAGPRDYAVEISALFRQVNEKVETATGGIDLKLLLPVALLAFAVLGLLAGALKRSKLPLPTWYDALWFAFNTFVILNLTLSKRKAAEEPERTEGKQQEQ